MTLVALVVPTSTTASTPATNRIQIDTPEVYFGTECFGRQASATTKRLLPEGTRVRLFAEPATDRVYDPYHAIQTAR